MKKMDRQFLRASNYKKANVGRSISRRLVGLSDISIRPSYVLICLLLKLRSDDGIDRQKLYLLKHREFFCSCCFISLGSTREPICRYDKREKNADKHSRFGWREKTENAVNNKSHRHNLFFSLSVIDNRVYPYDKNYNPRDIIFGAVYRRVASRYLDLSICSSLTRFYNLQTDHILMITLNSYVPTKRYLILNEWRQIFSQRPLLMAPWHADEWLSFCVRMFINVSKTYNNFLHIFSSHLYTFQIHIFVSTFLLIFQFSPLH